MTRPHRPRPLAATAAALFALLNCGGLDTFELREESSARIDGGTLLEQFVGDLGFGSLLNLDVTESEELKNQGVERHQIDSVRLTSLALTITDPPSGQDFTFLESLEFYVEAPGLPRQRIARGGPFPAGATRVELAADDLELAPYAAAESMRVTTAVTGRRPRQDTTVLAELALTVDVDVSGAACGE